MILRRTVMVCKIKCPQRVIITRMDHQKPTGNKDLIKLPRMMSMILLGPTSLYKAPVDLLVASDVAPTGRTIALILSTELTRVPLSMKQARVKNTWFTHKTFFNMKAATTVPDNRVVISLTRDMGVHLSAVTLWSLVHKEANQQTSRVSILVPCNHFITAAVDKLIILSCLS